eukprot:CAMPEP_0198137200 /NCGR_PEP_ID=MMETSP1443-20131203/732_1 /TAXON_ID=186043 /ORGANISM="Entomoneis sp., Strain CCMP2396" /LENGTH=120 /DNA_ID=CAMNT_0043798553 /DNA_START=23 /DNA_END=385 /DNA_ORIENTATION=+
MGDSSDLNYPNLRQCRVVIGGAPGVDQPPVRLPQTCVDAVDNFRLPTPYEFETEKKVLDAYQEQQAALGGNSPDEIRKSVLVRMKSVTNAQDDICVSILEDNKYDLKTSIEAFFASTVLT